MGAGRKRKYTPKALDAAVEHYFRTISRIVKVTEPVDSGMKDDKGHIVYENKPVLNQLGGEIKRLEYLIPPTVGGLCEALGIHRSTWSDWCDVRKHPEYADTTTRARGYLRAYLEQELLTRSGKDIKGIVFDLQNNHGYAEQRVVELGEKAEKALEAQGLSLAEREALLHSIGAEFGGAGEERDRQDG